jgi:hypothetical protein
VSVARTERSEDFSLFFLSWAVGMKWMDLSEFGLQFQHAFVTVCDYVCDQILRTQVQMAGSQGTSFQMQLVVNSGDMRKSLSHNKWAYII